MTKPLLTLENVQVFYDKTQVLWDINITLHHSEVICLIGLNGAGKSTLLRSISNVMVKREGSILYKGKDLKKVAPYRLVHMGIAHVPERRHIFASLSVEENLRLSAIPNSNKSEEELLHEVFDLFPDLKNRRNQLGGTLSGGQQQMVAIGRAVMANPRIILLDEPTLGLAPIITKQTLEAVRSLAREDRAILITEEKPSLILDISDRGYVIEAGRISCAAGVEELRRLNETGDLLHLRRVKDSSKGVE
jgi:branched-chain amino acid transport system ATP-binding protein